MRPVSAHAGINLALLAISAAVLAFSVAGYLGIGEPPLNGLAEEIMARTPALLADRLLDALGPIARPAAVLGAFAFVLIVAGIAGGLSVLPGKAQLLGLVVLLAGFVVLGAFGLGSALGIAAIGVLFFGMVVDIAPKARGGTKYAHTRRSFLRYAAVGTAGVMVTANTAFFVAIAKQLTIGRDGGRRLFEWMNPSGEDPRFAAAPMPVVQDVRDFYVMSKNIEDPRIVDERWKLEIIGDIGRAALFTLEDLQAMPRVDYYCTMRCVSNPADSKRWMSTALFTGVELRVVLERAKLAPGSFRGLMFRAQDGHEESHEWAEMQRSPAPAIIAYAMNGRELSQSHGFPVRLLVPGQYGFRNVKWLTEVRTRDGDRDGTWERRGWDAADIQTCSFCDGVAENADGRFAFGVAYSPVGIADVEVQVDGGDWQMAELSASRRARPHGSHGDCRSPSTGAKSRSVQSPGMGRARSRTKLTRTRAAPPGSRPSASADKPGDSLTEVFVEEQDDRLHDEDVRDQEKEPFFEHEGAERERLDRLLRVDGPDSVVDGGHIRRTQIKRCHHDGNDEGPLLFEQGGAADDPVEHDDWRRPAEDHRGIGQSFHQRLRSTRTVSAPVKNTWSTKNMYSS